MKTCVCADSAGEFWHAARLARAPLVDRLVPVPRDSDRLGIHPARVRSLEQMPPDEETLRRLFKAELYGLSRPLHVLIASAGKRSNTENRVCHVWSRAVPYGAFVRVGTGLYVTTPEFSFLQAAGRTGRVELVRLGYCLCGSYALPFGSHEGSRRCLPLSTAAQIRAFLRKVPDGVRGLRLARWAARYIVDGSGSPMESVTAMLLTLPRTAGGYGLPLPAMNRHLDVPCAKREIVGRSWVACDMRWPNGFALEYDGKDFHRGRANVVRDYSRSNDLDTMGVNVKTCSIEMIEDWTEFDRLARQVADAIGIRLRKRDFGAAWRRKNRELRKALIPRGEGLG